MIVDHGITGSNPVRGANNSIKWKGKRENQKDGIMNITKANLIQHPSWGKLLNELVTCLQEIYKANIPLPKRLHEGYKENDPVRSMHLTIQEYEFSLGHNYVCNSCHENISVSIKGIGSSEILSLSWIWTIVQSHGAITGYSTEGHSWSIVDIDLNQIALLPLVVSAAKVYFTEGSVQVAESQRQKADYLDAVAELAIRMLRVE